MWKNIFRYREAGLGRFDAAIKGATEVGGALLAATTTLVAAFFPLTFWPGIIGQFMSFLPKTLIIVLLSSLFVALVLYPTLTVIFVKIDKDVRVKEHGICKHSQIRPAWIWRTGYSGGQLDYLCGTGRRHDILCSILPVSGQAAGLPVYPPSGSCRHRPLPGSAQYHA